MSIKRKPKIITYSNERQKAIVSILWAYNWVIEKLRYIYEEEDLTLQQYNILRILRASPVPLSTLQIREQMLDKMSDTSRIVDRLVIKKLVKKVPCKGDKRLVDITVTTKAVKVIDKLAKKEEHMDEILQTLSLAEAKTLHKLLDKISHFSHPET
ncbi:MAG TPA: MarR family transcriptional regulator [Ferruginibacter sp.]|nr:MarR family transcriptional regulator [Ferruginibacter sp.]